MRLLFIITIMLQSILAFCQEPAFFETTFYFEDAVGNRDTMLIGHDPAANSSTINPQLGEIALTEPWDSVFEVRAAHSFNPATTWLNKVIGGVELQNFQNILDEYDCYLIQEWFYVGIYAKNLPITVSWDKSVFETNYCKVRSTISNHDLGNFFPNWDGPAAVSLSACLAEDSTFTTNLETCCGFELRNVVTLEGGAQDSVKGMFFQFQPMGTAGAHCSADFVVSTQDLSPPEKGLLYPNPTSTKLFYTDSQSRTYNVFDNFGNYIDHGVSSEIDLSAVPNGIYIIQYKMGNDKIVNERIVKMGK